MFRTFHIVYRSLRIDVTNHHKNGTKIRLNLPHHELNLSNKNRLYLILSFNLSPFRNGKKEC